jgi:hypothetical protein
MWLCETFSKLRLYVFVLCHYVWKCVCIYCVVRLELSFPTITDIFSVPILSFSNVWLFRFQLFCFRFRPVKQIWKRKWFECFFDRFRPFSSLVPSFSHGLALVAAASWAQHHSCSFHPHPKSTQRRVVVPDPDPSSGPRHHPPLLSPWSRWPAPASSSERPSLPRWLQWANPQGSLLLLFLHFLMYTAKERWHGASVSSVWLYVVTATRAICSLCMTVHVVKKKLCSIIDISSNPCLSLSWSWEPLWLSKKECQLPVAEKYFICFAFWFWKLMLLL